MLILILPPSSGLSLNNYYLIMEHYLAGLVAKVVTLSLQQEVLVAVMVAMVVLMANI
jgi:hypothetical protein